MNKQHETKALMTDVLIVCALPPEAKPVIAHYQLQHLVSEYGYKLYGLRTNKQELKEQCERSINVLVTGVGKLNTATALMWSRQWCKPKAFINVGIAGHGSADIGEIYLVNKVTDQAIQKSYFPSINFSWSGKTTQLKTVDVPSDEYQEGCAYDMEGSAFYDIANRFVSAENAHIIKVITDNSEIHFQQVSRNSVQESIANVLGTVEILIERLLVDETSDEENVNGVISRMRKKWHITVAQEQQLRDALLAIQIMESNTGLAGPQWTSFDRLKEFLQAAKKWLKNIKPKLV